MKRRIFAIISVLLALSMCLCACGGSAGSKTASANRYDMASSTMAYKNTSAGDFAAEAVSTEEFDSDRGLYEAETSTEVPDTDRKIVYTGSMSLETKDFDNALTLINTLISDAGGYVSSREVNGASLNYKGYYARTASITARVPSASFDSFMNGVSDICNVTQRSAWSEDISDTYYDAAARLESLELQEERLLSILAKADRLEDIITLEQELSDVRYQIETITAKLRRMDDKVDYSTVTLSLREVVEYSEIENEPVSFAEELKEAFSDGLESVEYFFKDLLLWAVADLPVLILWLALWSAIIYLAALIIRKLFGKLRIRLPKRKRREGADDTSKEENR